MRINGIKFNIEENKPTFQGGFEMVLHQTSRAAFEACRPFLDPKKPTEYRWQNPSGLSLPTPSQSQSSSQTESAAHEWVWLDYLLASCTRVMVAVCDKASAIHDGSQVTPKPTSRPPTWNSSPALLRHQSQLSFLGRLWRWQRTKKHIFSIWEAHLHVITWRLLHGLIRNDF